MTRCGRNHAGVSRTLTQASLIALIYVFVVFFVDPHGNTLQYHRPTVDKWVLDALRAIGRVAPAPQSSPKEEKRLSKAALATTKSAPTLGFSMQRKKSQYDPKTAHDNLPNIPSIGYSAENEMPLFRVFSECSAKYNTAASMQRRRFDCELCHEEHEVYAPVELSRVKAPEVKDSIFL